MFHIFGRKYRDHYLHQFQVFLLGISILDSFYKEFEKKYDKPEIIWLIVSSFHDITYPVQLYDKWTDQFFTEIFKTNNSFGTLDLKSRFIDENFLSCLNYIIDKLDKIIKINVKPIKTRNDLIKYFFEKITKEKNHGILSGISLLKIGHNHKLCNKENLLKYFESSAASIAIHDIWRIDTRPKVDNIRNILREDYLDSLNFDDDPITFLLIFCDAVQEWGRPLSDKKDRFYLERFKINKESSTKNVEIILRAYNHTEDNAIKEKQEELNDLKCFLTSSKIKFKIILQDKEGNYVCDYEF